MVVIVGALTMISSVKYLLKANLAFLTLAVPLVFDITPAQASSTCKDVYLQVINGTGKQIRVIDLDYYDPSDEKWRSEPVPNEEIDNGKTWQETRNLEKVNKMSVKIRVEYRVAKSNGKWGKVVKQEFPAQVCSHKTQYIMTVNKTRP